MRPGSFHAPLSLPLLHPFHPPPCSTGPWAAAAPSPRCSHESHTRQLRSVSPDVTWTWPCRRRRCHPSSRQGAHCHQSHRGLDPSPAPGSSDTQGDLVRCGMRSQKQSCRHSLAAFLRSWGSNIPVPGRPHRPAPQAAPPANPFYAPRPVATALQSCPRHRPGARSTRL